MPLGSDFQCLGLCAAAGQAWGGGYLVFVVPISIPAPLYLQEQSGLLRPGFRCLITMDI